MLLAVVTALWNGHAAAQDATGAREIVSFTRGAADSKAVALTFDDGPHPKLTPELMEILRAEGVTATFFMLGSQVEKFPEIARSVAEAGYEIGNHSYSHSQLTKLDSAQIEREISGTQDIIEQATGQRPRVFRAPYGSVNGTVRKKLLEEDLELTGWAVDPRDWERGKTSEGISAFILAKASSGDIILLHDIHARSVAAVVSVIRGLKAKGFEFTTAGDLINQRRDEMLRQPAPMTAVSSEGVEMPAAPALVPLSRSTLKRYEASSPPAAPAAE